MVAERQSARSTGGGGEGRGRKNERWDLQRLRTRTFLSSRHSPENAEAKQMRSRLTDGVFTCYLAQLVSLPCRVRACESVCVWREQVICVCVCVCESGGPRTKVKNCAREWVPGCTCKIWRKDVAMGSGFTISWPSLRTCQLIPLHHCLTWSVSRQKEVPNKGRCASVYKKKHLKSAYVWSYCERSHEIASFRRSSVVKLM